jgi:hypothetical protein
MRHSSEGRFKTKGELGWATEAAQRREETSQIVIFLFSDNIKLHCKTFTLSRILFSSLVAINCHAICLHRIQSQNRNTSTHSAQPKVTKQKVRPPHPLPPLEGELRR